MRKTDSIRVKEMIKMIKKIKINKTKGKQEVVWVENQGKFQQFLQQMIIFQRALKQYT